MQHVLARGFAVLALSFLSCACVASADESGKSSGWLNVQECGASGSRFETTASTTAGSKQFVVANVGDFKAGQQVIVSRCNIQYLRPMLWGPGEPYVREGQRPLGDAVVIRGYDGSAGSWLVYILEIDGSRPLTFRWSDDLARTWKANKVPVTRDWQRLSSGIEVRFNKQDLEPGHIVTFTARDQLISTIDKIEGKTLTLKDASNRTATDAVVRHSDSAALQAAVDRAIQEKKHVFVPVGYYRLTRGISVRNPGAILIEGASGVDTVLDISDGSGGCFSLYRGTEVTLRNFRMIGHTGQTEQAGVVHTSTGFNLWACALKSCSAVTIGGTERVLIENVHASRMASECFISGGQSRNERGEPKDYSRSVTFLRCSVTDCAANAFNTGDMAEEANVLYCRVDGAGIGWHMFEGSGHSLRVIGCYVRNAGAVTVGDIVHNLPRLDYLNELGIGRAVVADNVFEGIGHCGGIRVNHGPTQVAITNNLFINYNGTAIATSNATVHNSFPCQNIVISGNIIDMTYNGKDARPRYGIIVQTSDTTVSDNQVYVRGQAEGEPKAPQGAQGAPLRRDPKVTGLLLRDSALNVNVHDNLIRNCERGLFTERIQGKVSEVVNPTTFLQTGIPLQWRHSHLYRGWTLVWLDGGRPKAVSTIDSFDPDTLRFTLRQPCEMKPGDHFEFFPPTANWNIHNNTITGCLYPVSLDSYGSETSTLRDNIITRGDATGVKQAVRIAGRFNLIGNHITGFDEKDSAALLLNPDRFGKPCRNLYCNNLIERCARLVAENQDGLWKACISQGNQVAK